MRFWILKTEPSTYSFEDLSRETNAVWDGVKNPLALKYLKEMQPGDQVLVYHTGEERAVVGKAEITSAAYPDPKVKGGNLVVVNLKAGPRLPSPVSLADIKADPAFLDL